jgi:hypothetical protein
VIVAECKMVWDGAEHNLSEVIRIRGNLPLKTADYLKMI